MRFVSQSDKRDTGAVGGSDVTKRTNLAGFKDRHDIGVVEAGRCPRFLLEAGAQLGGDQDIRPRDLERHLAVELRIVGQKDDAVAALAQLAA